MKPLALAGMIGPIGFITLAAIFVAPVLGFVPLLPRLAITTLLTVALMTWAVMPLLTWVLRAWLTGAPASA
jgi:antibiotic biosynthesis monooxygenase (ABM) superfamily enzyme